MELRLLDGTRLRWTLPDALGRAMAGMTFADLVLNASVCAGPAPRGWRIDVAVGSVDSPVPGGEPIMAPPSSRISAAIVDRPNRRLALQFGPWALVASGDSLTDADIATLLAGVALAATPDGFVEYRGSLPLWTIDDAFARLGGTQASLSVFLGDDCSLTELPRLTAGGLDSYRSVNPDGPPGSAVLCDRVNQLRIGVHTSRPLTDEEIVTRADAGRPPEARTPVAGGVATQETRRPPSPSSAPGRSLFPQEGRWRAAGRGRRGGTCFPTPVG